MKVEQLRRRDNRTRYHFPLRFESRNFCSTVPCPNCEEPGAAWRTAAFAILLLSTTLKGLAGCGPSTLSPAPTVLAGDLGDPPKKRHTCNVCRDFARMAAALAAFGLPAMRLMRRRQDPGFKKLGNPQPFDYAWLKGHARALAAPPYQTRAGKLPDEVAALDWDQYQAIGYRDDHALWGDDKLRFRVEVLPPRPVLQAAGADARGGRRHGAGDRLRPRDVRLRQERPATARRCPADLGFAGFRVNFHSDWKRDIAAFLGASYFRAVGGDVPVRPVGARPRHRLPAGATRSSRDFTDFWLERPARRRRHARRLCAARFAQRRRRLPLRRSARRRAW